MQDNWDNAMMPYFNSKMMHNIMLHMQGQEEQVHQMRNKSSTVQVVLGSGPHRKLIITPMQWSTKKRCSPFPFECI